MPINLIDKIAPKNDAFQGMVDNDQIVGVGDGFLDEDDMVSNSDIAFASQQSIKAYTDNKAANIEGTAIKSTGEAGGTKYLREDGDGTCSWQAVSAGTVDVVSNVATSTILGRTTAGSGDSEELSAASVRTLLNVADGAEANVVDSVNTKTGAVVIDPDDLDDTSTTNKFTTAGDISKLSGIEALADVTDATNVDAAGATMNTDTSLSGNSYFLDEDTMSSDSATKVASQQSIKAYVDGAVKIPIVEKSITAESPTSSEDITWFFTNRAITVTEMRAVLVGSSTPSVTWTVRHSATDRSATGNEVVTGGTTTTSTTAGSDVTSFNDATIPADSFVWVETTAQSGTVDSIGITLIASID